MTKLSIVENSSTFKRLTTANSPATSSPVGRTSQHRSSTEQPLSLISVNGPSQISKMYGEHYGWERIQNYEIGVPTVVQWNQWHLCSARMQVLSLAQHSGLKDLGCSCGLDLILGLGTLAEQPKKKLEINDYIIIYFKKSKSRTKHYKSPKEEQATLTGIM